MSNNNPHSHINQTAQNSSWNPLQIPSYIPRQPQLAHMSNERPMVRSPLAWHAAAPPPESLYNFMSAANHKNLEHSMNPLLPPYVRGPPPFDSMDLSLQSNRSASSPLSKNAHSLLQPPPPSQLEYGHKQAQHQHNLHQQQAQQQIHAQNSYPIHNLSTSTAQTQQHTAVGMQNASTAQASSATTQSSSGQNSGKFLSSNGNDCEQQSSLIQTSQASTLSSNNGSSYQRHSAESYAKMTHMNRSFENDPHSKSLQKPVELVNKDCTYNAIMPNKLPSSHLQQQSSTKKHSPLRSGAAAYHIPQSPQQSPFNSPAPTGKHNGPHTPPTPQSPGMHQTHSPTAASTQPQLQTHQALIHGGCNANAGVLDYNQLHLQQPLNSYSQPHLQQSQQQQQQQHMHHGFPQSQLHQHWQQQQPTQPPNAVSLSSQHHHQATSHAHMQPPQINSPRQQQQQQQQQRQSHQKSLSNMEPASPATPAYVVNAEAKFEQRNIEHQTNIVPPPATCTSPRCDRIPDSAESPDINASSNDDDSCEGKSMLRKHNLKKSPQEKDRSLVATSGEINKIKSSSKSPKSSPNVHQRRSPQKSKMGSPESLDLSSQRSANLNHIQSPAVNPASPTSGGVQQHDDSETDSITADRQQLEILKNGCTPPDRSDDPAEGEVETIDKIAEMIAKTASNSSHSNNSNDANSNSSSKSARTDICESPKTKKQRQALKLRNAEHNTEWAANLNHDSNVSIAQTTTETASIPLATNDDNAVLAEELRKNVTPPPLSPRKQPMSPQTNSRSSSSSSSSSSCSISSRSSCCSKSQKSKPTMSVDAISSEANISKMHSPGKENLCDGDKSKLKVGDNPTPDNQPLNLNCKTSTEQNNVPATPASPDKSRFEEVENKLEEMFAGIEDEPPPENTSIVEVDFGTAATSASDADAAAVATDLSAALELSNSLKDRVVNESPLRSIASKVIKPSTPPPVLSAPVQTKAAKKSTVPSPVNSETRQTETTSLRAVTAKTSTESMKDTSKSSETIAAPPPRKPMPRRRLSVALDPSNLRIMLENTEESKDSVVAQRHEKTKVNNRELIVQLGSGTKAKEDTNKTTVTDKSRTNKGNKSTSSTSSSKARTGNAASTSSSASKANSKPPSKKTKQNSQQKASQQKRRKQSSSDEDVASTNTREPTASMSNSNVSNDKFKSPFVLIKRDGSVSVVNAATAEDNGNDKQIKTKKLPAPYTQHERRNIRGFHSSTLSQKYDADTTDSTWICVFCKRGPHRTGLGDLFGPYIVTIDCEEYRNAINATDTINVDEEFVSKRRRIDMVQCNARGPPVVLATKAQEALGTANRTTKKKKKSIDESNPLILQSASTCDPLDVSNETYQGMNKVSDNSYEVWLHEDCTVWAPNVFLVGARIMGLEGAVWNSTRYQCVLCVKYGATVCCLERECKAAAHVPCAREALWRLNESNWHVHCPAHIKSNNSVQNCPSTAAHLTINSAVSYATHNPSTSIS